MLYTSSLEGYASPLPLCQGITTAAIRRSAADALRGAAHVDKPGGIRYVFPKRPDVHFVRHHLYGAAVRM